MGNKIANWLLRSHSCNHHQRVEKKFNRIILNIQELPNGLII